MKWTNSIWFLLAMSAASVSAQQVETPTPGVSKGQALKIQRHVVDRRDKKAVATLDGLAQGTLWCDLAFDKDLADQLRADIGVLARRQKRRDEAWTCVDFGLRRPGAVHRASALYEASKLVRTAPQAELRAAVAHAIETQQKEEANDRCLGSSVSIVQSDDKMSVRFMNGSSLVAEFAKTDLVGIHSQLNARTPVSDVVCLLTVAPALGFGSWKEQRTFVADGLVVAAARYAPKTAYVEKFPGLSAPSPNSQTLGVYRPPKIKKKAGQCWGNAPGETCAKQASKKVTSYRPADAVEITHVRWDERPDPTSAGGLHHDHVLIEASGQLHALKGGVGSSMGNYGNENASSVRAYPDHFVYEYTSAYHDAGSSSFATRHWLCSIKLPIRCLTWRDTSETSAWGPHNKGWSWIPKHSDAAKRRAVVHRWSGEDYETYDHPAPFVTVVNGRISLGSPDNRTRKHDGVFQVPGYEVLEGLTLEEAFEKVDQLNASSPR